MIHMPKFLFLLIYLKLQSPWRLQNVRDIQKELDVQNKALNLSITHHHPHPYPRHSVPIDLVEH